MTPVELTFVKAGKTKDYKKIYEHSLGAFSETPDFEWTFEDIKNEVSDGWELFSVNSGKNIVAAIFYKIDKKRLLTKNTALKMNFQGSGYSHRIKEYFEEVAKDKKAEAIVHYCGIDNFRAYSLNESHGYEKTSRKLGDKGQVVEWVKPLRKKK